ncbi:MAG: serine hydrolase [Acidobacteria bacterium]|nr:serine hydrolase [Acidobacteriota bacterium]MDA1236132.1 serine hydrolase [Acidobacteriota bacterium]
MLTKLVRSTLLFAVAISAIAQQAYFPPRGEWERRTPEQMNINAAALKAAVDFSIASESTDLRDLEENHPLSWGREPFDEPLGPFRTRGPQSGLIIKDGYVVAEWGEINRVDMTFSVTKSVLSSTVGLIFDDGLIRDVHDPVRDYMPPIALPVGDGEPGDEENGIGNPNTRLLFESEHNRKITWDHLLRQTSDWEGTLWGKPDWGDRPGDDVKANRTRKHYEPGEIYKYNDVRVNLLSLVALQVARRPLPQLFRERIMDPIGASNTWRWQGYKNSWVEVDGQMINSVPGGGHWGGGMHINALDQARFGYLTLNKGKWNGRQLLSQKWLAMAETPTKAEPGYGFMNFFLNTGRKAIPAAPESAFRHVGAGSNIIYVDRENGLVVVTRWIQGSALPEFIEKVLAAMPK